MNGWQVQLSWQEFWQETSKVSFETSQVKCVTTSHTYDTINGIYPNQRILKESRKNPRWYFISINWNHTKSPPPFSLPYDNCSYRTKPWSWKNPRESKRSRSMSKWNRSKQQPSTAERRIDCYRSENPHKNLQRILKLRLLLTEAESTISNNNQ